MQARAAAASEATVHSVDISSRSSIGQPPEIRMTFLSPLHLSELGERLSQRGDARHRRHEDRSPRAFGLHLDLAGAGPAPKDPTPLAAGAAPAPPAPGQAPVTVTNRHHHPVTATTRAATAPRGGWWRRRGAPMDPGDVVAAEPRPEAGPSAFALAELRRAIMFAIRDIARVRQAPIFPAAQLDGSCR